MPTLSLGEGSGAVGGSPSIMVAPGCVVVVVGGFLCVLWIG